MDQELLQAIEQLKLGDKKGFPVIYENTYKYVYSRAKCMFSEEQDILDLVQEVYLEMYRNIDSLESNESFYAWLKTITFYQGTKMWRKQGKEILTSEEVLDEFLSEDISIEEECTNKQDIEIIKDCIAHLSDEQKTVILAYYYDNLKVEEIAELFFISVGTVKSRLYLARKKLKGYIEEQEKKQGYTLYSFSGATIALAFGTFLQQGEEGAKHYKKFLYKSICKELGLNYGGALGLAKLAELGVGKGSLVVIGAIASVAVVGGIGLAVTGLLGSNKNSDAVNGSEGHFFETESIGNGTEFTESTEVQEENQTETEGEPVTGINSSNIEVDLEKYRYCYDTNRDGIVTNAEIDAYDKRFYAEEPTSTNQRKLLLAGYNTVVDFGNNSFAVMVDKSRGDESFSYGCELLETYFIEKGFAARSMYGGNLDEERYQIGCTIEPIKCSVSVDFPDFTSENYDRSLFKKIYGYKNATEICSRYVEFGFYDGSKGVVEDGYINFNFNDILYICDFMSKQNPASYLENCPYPVNEVYLESDGSTYAYYTFAIDIDASYSEIEALVNEMKRLAKLNYPGYVHDFNEHGRGGGADYIEGSLESYFLHIYMPTESTTLTCNQSGQEYSYTFNNITSINRIDSVDYTLSACRFNEIALELTLTASSVEWNHTYNESVSVDFHFKIFNLDGECVIDSGLRSVNGQNIEFSETYYLPPGQYTITFYNIEH